MTKTPYEGGCWHSW